MEEKHMSWTKRGVALVLLLLFVVSTSIVLGAPAQRNNKQTVGRSGSARAASSTATLIGRCIKMGVKSTGSLGIGENTNPGIQYDDSCSGTFNDAYDFLTPGTPYEGISVNADNVSYVEWNTDPFYPGLAIDSNQSLIDKSGIAYLGETWDKRVIQQSENAKFVMVNDIRFNNYSKFIEIKTSITPKSNIAEMYVGRAIDSDAVVSGDDSSATNNALGYSTIGSDFLVFSETTSSKYVMGYYTGEETNVKAGISGGWDNNSKAYYSAPNDGNGDNTIGIVKKFLSVNTGTTVSFSYAYIFGKSAYRSGKMAIDLGIGGGTPGKTPGCGSTPSCAPVDIGSAVMTNTPGGPTYTAEATDTPFPTNTPAGPTSTYTPVPPTSTFTPVPPTATRTPVPPTATATATATLMATATSTPSVQTITFATPPNKLEGGASFSLAATSSVGGTVTYSSSTTAVCTVTSAGVVSMLTYGDCTITANAAAITVSGVSYAAAAPVTRTFTVNAVQTIVFPTPADKIYTAPDYNLTATTNSGLALSFTSSTSSVCTVTTSGTVDLIGPGTCTITAAQAGGLSGGKPYASASVTKSFEVTAPGQTITVPTLPEWYTYNGDEITLTGTSSSGLPVTYTSTTPLVCTVVGNKLKVVGPGKCSIKISQPGGTTGGVTYGAAPDVTREFFISDSTATPTKTSTPTRTFTATKTPTPIPFLLKKGAVGASFVLGLLQNGTLVTWGMNREFQANIPPCCGSGITDVAVGTNFALALKGGKVYGWGANTKKQITFPQTTAKDIVSIAAGGSHGMALTKKGLVYAWGDAGYKQTTIPKGLKDVVSIAAGKAHSLVVKKDGTVVAWGANESGQTKVPAGLKTVVQVAGGLDHSLALKKDGTVVGWGGNAFNQSTTPPGTVDMKQVSAGNQFSLAVKKDGTVFGWGRNDNNVYVIPPEYTDIYTVAAGYANTILGLRNGRIIVLGDQTNDVAVSRTPTRTATPTP